MKKHIMIFGLLALVLGFTSCEDKLDIARRAADAAAEKMREAMAAGEKTDRSPGA